MWKPGKSHQLGREETINRYQPQDDIDVGIIRWRLTAATLSVTIPDMNGRVKHLDRNRSYKKELSGNFTIEKHSNWSKEFIWLAQ